MERKRGEGNEKGQKEGKERKRKVICDHQELKISYNLEMENTILNVFCANEKHQGGKKGATSNHHSLKLTSSPIFQLFKEIKDFQLVKQCKILLSSWSTSPYFHEFG